MLIEGIVIYISLGYGEIPRHLYHGTTPPEQIGADGMHETFISFHRGVVSDLCSLLFSQTLNQAFISRLI